MARQSLSPMKDFNYETDREAMVNDQSVHKRRDFPMTHLKYLRKKSGYTLDALSQITSISISYLSRLESGSRRLNTDLIKRLSKAFGCDPAELLQESPAENRVITPIEFTRRRRMDLICRDGMMPLYFITRDEEDPEKLTIKITAPSEWKVRPTELLNRDRVFALRAEEYFLPYFGKTSTLYLEPAEALVPESTVVLLSCGKITIKKVWSVTPTALELCDMADIEKMKSGETVGSLVTVERSAIDFIYKVVGYSDFTLDR